MRIIKEYGYKEFQFAIKSVEDDYKAGRITRDEAKRSTDKIKKLYSTGEVKRNLAKATEGSNNVRIINGE